MNNKRNIVVTLLVSQVMLTAIVIHAQTDANKPMVPMVQKQYAYNGRMNSQDSSQVEDFRQAGLRNDHSHIASMIKMLSDPPHVGYTYTTIHALAQMGAMEALPVISTYSQSDNLGGQSGVSSDLCNFSLAAKARLVAESVVKVLPSSKIATTTKIKRFYQELGLTPYDLNEALNAYYFPQQIGTGQGIHHWISVPADSTHAHPVGLYAVREIADMMYHGDYTTCASMPEISQVDFAADYPSALKARLAPLSPPERLNTMLRELSHKTVLTHWDNYEIQLASNEGLAASHAAATLLKTMEAHPSQYKEVGFTALVRVMWGTGDKEQAPLVQHLLESRLINTGNLPIADLANGVKRAREPAY